MSDAPGMPDIDGLGLTARWVAALRERESQRADRLFHDPLAGVLAGDEGRTLMARVEADLPALANNRGLAVRTRYLDDMLARAVDDGIRQVVILAAGMDARAFRLRWPEGTTVYEVERPDVLALKERLLAPTGAQPQARRLPVGIDLREDFATALRQSGFRPGESAVFLVEGLLVYLPDRAAALRILREVAGLAAPGSRVGLDVVGARFLQLPFLAPIQQRLVSMGAVWAFGTDEPAALLHEAGFASADVMATGSAPYAPPAESSARLVGDAYFMVTGWRG